MKLALLAARSSIHTVRWANALAHKGHEVSLITMHRGEEKLDGAVMVFNLPVPAPFGYLLNVFKLQQLLSAIKPDVLHAHFASGYGTLASLSNYRPLLISVWGSDVYSFPQKSLLHQMLLVANLRKANRICSTSKVMAEQVRSLAPILQAIDIVPFGIDRQIFYPQPELRRKDVLTVGTVKSLAPQYGIDLLIRAFAGARERLQNDAPETAARLRLLIVGGGPQKKELEELAAFLNLHDVVTFAGAVPHVRVPDYLNQLDIYVAASRRESFGVAPLEASACGLPVLVSDAPGLKEVVRHGETGLIVPRDDVPALTDGLVTLIKDAGLRLRLGEKGRRWVAQQYDWTENVQAMERIYRQMSKH
jgi:L-malate glycosyltransferase